MRPVTRFVWACKTVLETTRNKSKKTEKNLPFLKKGFGFGSIANILILVKI
jgi:hypothetical protein